ncbi:hypothetical protein [uncultured Litoreibacter sp.]|uniref:hypothetical protein n=1 Tax=uncultured Litoreibacter sp. TaxID=1392394 RepID=UPI002605F088|nr:hypothetical protein [uncultured Litoreibacter sp.]
MRINGPGLILTLSLAAAPIHLAAQTDSEPLSAIDWLSDVVREVPKPITNQPAPSSQDVTESASVIEVTTTPLGQIKLDAVGLLPRSTTGLPADFWTRSSAKALGMQLSDLRADLPPPLSQFLTTLLLAELPAPADSADGAEMFLARVDKFLEIGALDQAQALVQRAGPTRPVLFGRWFDVSLLTGREDAACTSMLQTPSIAPTYPARIFCLARAGDWDAAALTLGTGETLGVITKKEVDLLSRFLDPELFEGEPLLPIPDRITPLTFRMHEAIGEPLSLGGLPHAFAYANLSDKNGWKSRISAAERLTRTGAIPPSQLFALYNERTPAASGGVWDRVEAIQAFETSLKAGDLGGISTHLPRAMRAMRSAGLEHAFAQSYGPQLGKFPLTSEAKSDAIRAGLMSKDYELAANSDLPSGTPELWKRVATGQLGGARSDDALEAAVIAAFNAETPPEMFASLLSERRLGEAVIQAMGLMADGPRSDPADIERGLTLLNQLGLADVARQTALHMLLTRPRA